MCSPEFLPPSSPWLTARVPQVRVLAVWLGTGAEGRGGGGGFRLRTQRFVSNLNQLCSLPEPGQRAL